MPIRFEKVTCPMCNGIGKVPTSQGQEKCCQCKGTGQYERPKPGDDEDD